MALEMAVYICMLNADVAVVTMDSKSVQRCISNKCEKKGKNKIINLKSEASISRLLQI